MIELKSKLLEADYKALVVINPLLFTLVYHYKIIDAFTQLDKREKLVYYDTCPVNKRSRV